MPRGDGTGPEGTYINCTPTGQGSMYGRGSGRGRGFRGGYGRGFGGPPAPGFGRGRGGLPRSMEEPTSEERNLLKQRFEKIRIGLDEVLKRLEQLEKAKK